MRARALNAGDYVEVMEAQVARPGYRLAHDETADRRTSRQGRRPDQGMALAPPPRQLDLALEASISSAISASSKAAVCALARDGARPCPSISACRCGRGTSCCSRPASRPPSPSGSADPSMNAARTAVELVLQGHTSPTPPSAIDRYWTSGHGQRRCCPPAGAGLGQVAAAGPGQRAAHLRSIPAALRPSPISRRWKAHVHSGGQRADQHHLRSQADLTGTGTRGLPRATRRQGPGYGKKPMPSRSLRTEAGRSAPVLHHHDNDVRTPVDVTLSELAVEAFFPANAETSAAMQAMAKARQN